MFSLFRSFVVGELKAILCPHYKQNANTLHIIKAYIYIASIRICNAYC